MTTNRQKIRENLENAIMQLNDALEFEDWDIVKNVISDDLEPTMLILRKL